MTNLVLVGACGRMGRTVSACAAQSEDMRIVAGVDVSPCSDTDFPMYRCLDEVKEQADVLIDFSRPDALPQILSYCEAHSIGAVLASTGYDAAQKELIAQAGSRIAIFQTPNFSIGVALLSALIQQAARVLAGRADIEIVERHHNRKVDAPSGTALALADAVSDVLPGSTEYVFGREGSDAKRARGQIGIHAVRGGTLVGEHEVMFLAPDEELDITHRAYSRDIFAQGALAAARFLADAKPGIYDMKSLLRAMGLDGAE